MHAPISSLPSEILSAIFEAGYHDFSPPQRGALPFEILVSRITQRWRFVAMDTPLLWAKITLKTRRTSNMVADYIHRSKASPLNLIIGQGFWNATPKDIIAVCSLINPHVKRWHRLQIFGDSAHIAFLFQNLPPSAPSLRHIKIRFRYTLTGELAPVMFPGGAPSLTSMLLYGMPLQKCYPTLESLTHLELHESLGIIDVTRIRSLVASFPALTHLVLAGGEFYDPDWTPRTIHLPSLRSLHFRSQLDPNLILALLTVISAPLLDSLVLETLSLAELELLDPSRISPNYPSLRSLVVQMLSESYLLSYWNSLAGAFPSVTHFTLSHDDLDTFFESLSEPGCRPEASNISPMWPGLQVLTLVQGPRVNMLGATISARITSGHPIRTIRLSKSIISALTDNDLEWLRARVEVEECTMYPELTDDTDVFIIHWDHDGE